MEKKSFKDNPAYSFITPQEPEEEAQRISKPLKKDYSQPETKSDRVQLLIRPTLKANLINIAKAKDISLNELIHKALEEYARKEQ